jgi:hypothetical protein
VRSSLFLDVTQCKVVRRYQDNLTTLHNIPERQRFEHAVLCHVS